VIWGALAAAELVVDEERVIENPLTFSQNTVISGTGQLAKFCLPVRFWGFGIAVRSLKSFHHRGHRVSSVSPVPLW
jgi:hypothetical protein